MRDVWVQATEACSWLAAMTTPLGELLREIEKTAGFGEVLEALDAGGSVDARVVGGFGPAVTAAMAARTDGPVVVVTRTVADAERFVEEVEDYLDGDRVAVLPDWESYPFETVRPDVEAVGRRSQIFERLLDGEPLVIAMAVSTLLQKVPPPAEAVYVGLKLPVGEEIGVDALLERLIELGYVRSAVVERTGEFAARGSVVDIFPAQGERPIRLDFFGDEIESIKDFDIASQRSLEGRGSVEVRPSREFRLDDAAAERVMGAGGSPYDDDGLHRWLPVIHGLVPVTDYFPTGTIWVLDEPKAVFDEASRFYEEQEMTLAEAYVGETPFGVADYYVDVAEVKSGLRPRLALSTARVSSGAIDFAVSRPREIKGEMGKLESELRRSSDEGLRAVLVLADEGELHRVGELLSDLGLPFERGRAGRSATALVVGRTAVGYVDREIGLIVFGRTDIFPRRAAETGGFRRARRQSLIDFSDLVPGELLVHEVHGIARYAALTKQSVGGKTREYLILEYADGDRLYVPMEQLDRVTRYVAPEGARADITRLSGTEWQRATKKARRSIKKLAVDLMDLYSERAESRGHAFSPDTEWQHDLEAAFPYQATRDQAAAITAVKEDMEATKPMDRLVCGDVGYGKTEVALRAAFKAINDGKQVLMLVPTTILAQQHYLTFEERFAPYPVKVEMLSRFLGAGQQKEVVKRARAGKTDMVIGTHRLLQKDVRFHDLGLIIVDEEQRFGVNHKEKLRTLRKVVDVLTLSATPIPRTLQMSISGIRDLSFIETPPEGRHPVITYIGEFQPATIRGAVRRELARGGQVFYVHNRVETIDRMAAQLQEIVPEAKVIVGHGKMTESELEKVMLSFLDRRADILVCTTIIESGIDISSANTLIIENADQLGLAQLYQLRGRVGRGRHRGYAYLTYRPDKSLTDPAVERLKTIGEFTELGSGYRVALKDLELRGAGNVLGAEQHGHMISIGFDLFCRMLRREIDELQGQAAPQVSDVKIELPVNAYIPAGYISEENVRLEVYRSIAEAHTHEEIAEAAEAVTDRFGALPPPVANLIDVARLRSRASERGILSIMLYRGRLVIRGESDRLHPLSARPGAKLKAATGEVVLRIPVDQPRVIEFIIEIISDIMP